MQRLAASSWQRAGGHGSGRGAAQADCAAQRQGAASLSTLLQAVNVQVPKLGRAQAKARKESKDLAEAQALGFAEEPPPKRQRAE